MRRRSFRFSLAAFLLALASAYVHEPHAASCPKVVLVNNGATSGNERAPNANFQYGRAVYLIPEAELIANGLPNGSSPAGIGWNYAVRPGVTVSGSLKVYLENTSDTTNIKNTTWTTAITGMTLVHNATTTLPDVTGPWNIVFSGGSGFTYGGHGLYVAFDWQNPGGGGGTASVLCNNALANDALKGAQSNTSPPPTLANSTTRPETQLTAPAPDNDASIDSIAALGSLPEGLVGPQAVTAVVSNHGGLGLTNLHVTLNVTGADSFTDTQTVASLSACGGQASLSFAPYAPFALAPSALGSNTVAVSVPADDVAANNGRSVPQSVTANQYSYKYPGTTATGGFGFNGVTGEVDALFSTAVETQIDSVTLEFPTVTGATYRLAIRLDDGAGLPGSMLYVDSANRTVATPGPITVRLPFPVDVGPGIFFVGVRQTGTTGVGLSYDSESPLRSGAFYRQTPLGSGPWTDFIDAGLAIKLNLGMTLGPCLVPLSVDVTPDGTSTACSGGNNSFTAGTTGGTGTLTYQWMQDGVDIPSATTAGYIATSGAPGTFAYNVRVTDDAGCVDVQDASDSTGAWVAPPTATVAGGGGICPGGSSAIHADLTGTGPWNVAWSDGFNQNGVAASPATRVVSPASTTTYTVSSVSDVRCSGSSGGSAMVTVSSPPSETAPGNAPGTILLWSSKTQIVWPANPGANSYKMYRGVLSGLPSLLNSSNDSCAKFQGAATSTTDTSAINPGTLFWYLVSGVADGCEGPVGNALVNFLSIPRIPNDSGTCPP